MPEDTKNCNRCGLTKPLDLDPAASGAGYAGYGAAAAPVQRASPYGFTGDLVTAKPLGKPCCEMPETMENHGKIW